jgi:glycosyltransferase involved in cell wall biosynthesis
MKRWINALRLRLRLLNRQRLRRRHSQRRLGYQEWVAAHDTLGEAEQAALQVRLAALPQRPCIALLMPVCNPPIDFLRQAIASVRAQIYPGWELCIIDEASTDPAVGALLAEAAADPRIRLRHREQSSDSVARSNEALALAEATFVALLDHDDVLGPHALLLMAEALLRFPQAMVVYSDEDRLTKDGLRCDPCFKPDWNPELLLSQDYLGRLVVYRAAHVRTVGAFRAGFEGAQDHDLALRCTEDLAPGQIVHIPHVLYHRRQHASPTAGSTPSKPRALEAGRRAVGEALQRRGVAGTVADDGHGGYAISISPPQPEPEVTLIVPTRDGLTTLPRCFDSLVALTRYRAWRLLIVDNGSVDPAFMAELRRMQADPRVRVRRDDSPFNYAALNNRAVAEVESDFVVLLNDDTEILTPDWLHHLIGWAAQPGVGAVGARLWYPDMTLQHAGVVLGIGDVAGHVHRHLGQADVGFGGRAVVLQNFSAVSAACLAVSRSHYLKAGGMDEKGLAVAFNDVDFCLKLQRLGLRNVWVPLAELKHYESVSRGSDREARRRQRCQHEAAVMRQRWGAQLAADPAYNPNLTLRAEDFALADPPRVDLRSPWFASRPGAVFAGSDR